MSVASQQFPFVAREPSLGRASLFPMLPLTLAGDRHASVHALLDTGAAVNVLPYMQGVELGFDWIRCTKRLELTGNLAAVEARAITVSATIGTFSPARLIFAWAQSESIPVIMGHVNFFMEFDVCFFRARAIFDVRPK